MLPARLMSINKREEVRRSNVSVADLIAESPNADRTLLAVGWAVRRVSRRPLKPPEQ
jgi:hypothetical protein